MPEGIFGVETSQLLIAVGGVAAGFLCLILVLWLIRGRGGPSPFLRGGKNRQPRLQVLDAAAVDTRRRLVLVRRDDVEHLIMIGGPTDVVIESSIVDGRSPPYHTMMKTVSEPERAAIAADQEPRVSEQVARPAEVSAPPARVTPIEKAEQPTKTEDKDNFAWLGSEPVELSPAEPARTATPPQPVAHKPEPPKRAETASAPAQSVPTQSAPVSPAPAAPAPAAKAAEVAPPAETRAADPKPVVDFPVIEPRSTSAATAGPAPVMPAFSASSAAVAVAPVVVAPIAMKAEPAAMDVARNIEPGFEIESPRAQNDAPSLDNAVDLLDAVRDRVFQQPRPEATLTSAPAPVVTPVQRPAPAVVQMPMAAPAPAQQPAPAKPLGSDFERILEEEMATNLAGGNAAPAIGPATSNTSASQLPRRDPGMPRVTGATQEPALQNEIARIFGEMSVTKDDR